MNPMMRWAYAIHDVKNNQIGERMQRKRDAHKVKLREEKEMRRLDAIERDNKRRTEQKSPTPEKEGEEPKMEESAACKFQKELCWCIQQLEMGLDNKKASSQKAPEAERLLKILKSSKAPMARKRQVMRASFGNYRARMQQEEKKHSEDMVKKKSLTPAECEKLGTATFFRRSTSSMSPSPHDGTRYVNRQPVIPEIGNEDSEINTKEQGAHRLSSNAEDEEEEDILMKSLELETMDMHLCKSEDSQVTPDAGSGSHTSSAAFHHEDQPYMDNKMAVDSLKKWKKEKELEEEEEEENEKENIPSRTPTDTEDTNHSQISSTFSSCASLFSFNFEIKEEDMDVVEGSHPFTTTATHLPKCDGPESRPMMRGLDNRASDSTSSSGGTPTKRTSRKRNRGKRKQQQQQKNEDLQQSDDVKTSPKEALLTESPKIELAAKEGFRFDFPDPVET